MDDQKYLCVSDFQNHEVRRYKIGDQNGTIVAGGNGKGADLNQLNWPTFHFVDQQQTVYVSDNKNHRVMTWNKGAKEGIVVTGGQGYGSALTQLNGAFGLFVDTFETLYVADSNNDQVMRWPQGVTQGTVTVGGNGRGEEANQFNCPVSYQVITMTEACKIILIFVSATDSTGLSCNKHMMKMRDMAMLCNNGYDQTENDIA
ncbi:unnamed protein product [Rotaria sp. Silwood1]|nr:unnamed protein product [Rotaria sp. Silwood1]CAF3328321.1 unnamed protein product [Rotaria sp. Silwood1]